VKLRRSAIGIEKKDACFGIKDSAVRAGQL